MRCAATWRRSKACRRQPAGTPWTTCGRNAERCDRGGQSGAAFGLKDLSFSGMDYATLTLEGAKAALGEPAGQTAAEDAVGGTYLNLTWSGVELIWLEEAAGGRAQSLRVSNAQTEGPRGLKAGMTFEEASSLFLSEGQAGCALRPARGYGLRRSSQRRNPDAADLLYSRRICTERRKLCAAACL